MPIRGLALFVLLLLSVVTAELSIAQVRSDRALALQQKAQSAQRESDKLTAEQREVARKLFSSAFSLMQKDETKAARLGFERALSLDPADARGNFYLAEVLMALGETEAARERFELVRLLSAGSEEDLKAELRLSELSASKPAAAELATGQLGPDGKRTLYSQMAFNMLLKERMSQGQPDSASLRSAVREELNTRALLVLEARKQGLDKRPEVALQMERAEQTVLSRVFVNEWTRGLSEADLRAEYELRKRTRSGTAPPYEKEKQAITLEWLDRLVRELRAQQGM